jgi:hypothetical protein
MGMQSSFKETKHTQLMATEKTDRPGNNSKNIS